MAYKESNERVKLESHEYVMNYCIGVSSVLYLGYAILYRKLPTYDKILGSFIAACMVATGFAMGTERFKEVTRYAHTGLWLAWVLIVFSKNKFLLMYGVYYGLCMLLIWEWNGRCSLGSHDPSGEGGTGLVGSLIGTITIFCTVAFAYKLSCRALHH